MNSFYQLLEDIRDHFLTDGITKTCRFADISTVSDDKNTVFSKVVIDLTSATPVNGAVNVSLVIAAVDLIDVEKIPDPDDEFFGGDNYIDILQSQMHVLTKFSNRLRSGTLSVDYELQGQPVLNPFKDNYIAGFLMNVTIAIKNETSAC